MMLKMTGPEKFLALKLLALICLVALASEQNLSAADDLAGKEVLVISPNAKVRVEEEVVGTVSPGELLKVEKTNGDWLWIPTHDGWMMAEDVILKDKAVEYFTKQIEKKPTPENYELRGKANFSTGKYGEAVKDYNTAIEKGAKYVSVFINRGRAFWAGADQQQAYVDFSTAIKADPKNYMAYSIRSHLQTEMFRFEEALKDADAAITINPKYAEAHNNRGLALQSLKKPDEALKSYTKAIELQPSLGSAYGNRGIIYQDQGEYAKALKDYESALQFDPGSVEFQNNLAWLLATCPKDDLRDGQKAVDFALKACEQTGFKDANLLDTLAAAYAENKNFKEAIRWTTEALKYAEDFEKPDLNKHLELYKKEEPVRVSAEKASE